MKILLISDIHNRVSWIKPCLTDLKGQYDKVVFLGDYFDNFDDNEVIATQTAEWLHEMVNTKEFGKLIFLLGNHDVFYRSPKCYEVRSSGNTVEKSRAINTKMTPKDWLKFKLVHHETGHWYFSHAGLSKYHFFHTIEGITHKRINSICDKALDDLRIGHCHPAIGCGIARYGDLPIGGVTWQDWNLEFNPLHGINQIVGHTRTEKPRRNSIPGSENWNIDCDNKYITFWEDGVVTHKTNKWLKHNT
jgi:predicted phosphodiesterase